MPPRRVRQTRMAWDPFLRQYLNRDIPVGPVGAYKTYAILQPTDTRERAACQDVGCLAYRRGWESAFDESTDLGKAQASYIRWESGRDFKESRNAAGMTVFRFKANQRCFAEHFTHPQIFDVRGGDWRGNPTGQRRRHATVADWVEDSGEHLQRIADQAERG